MRLGTVSRLWRYPVKSMAGDPLDAAMLGWRGIPGDRGWAVHDETRGGITGAKRMPLLRAIRARYLREPESGAASPPVELTFPDGVRITSDDPDVARQLAEHLGRPVSLRSLGPAGSASERRVTSEGESDDAVRALMGLEPGEPMPDMSAFPPERLRLLRQGNFFDALPLHVITEASLETLARRAPESNWDVRRFRPNLLVSNAAGGDYPEQAWIGRRLRVGAALLEVVTGCPRCVMVTQPVDDVPHDPRIMRTLVRETKHTAGIYLGVVEEGAVRIGDPIERVD